MPQPRVLEPELMDLPDEARAYAAAAFGTVNQAFVDRLLEIAAAHGMAPSTSLSLLDLGTGPGDIPLRIATARPQWQIVAVDGAAAMLELARAAIGAAGVQSIHLVLADAKATGLPDHSFGLICSNSLLHHMPDPQPLWREIKRLGRPGATLVLRDLFRPDSAESAHRIVQQHAGQEPLLLQEEFHRSLLAAFTPEEIRGQLRDAGLGHLNVFMASDRHVDVRGRL